MENYKHAKKERLLGAKRKTSQQQGLFRAKARLEQLHNKFINLLMRNGEKSKASKLFDKSLYHLQSKPFLIKNEKQDFFRNSVCASLPTTFGGTEKTNILKDYAEALNKSSIYQAVENIKPTLELRRVRKGGTTYQVPAIVSQKRQERLAIKWIIESALKRKKKNKTDFSNCLVKEIVEALNKTGQPRQRRDEQLKIAEYNRAYTRYRWW